MKHYSMCAYMRTHTCAQTRMHHQQQPASIMRGASLGQDKAQDQEIVYLCIFASKARQVRKYARDTPGGFLEETASFVEDHVPDKLGRVVHAAIPLLHTSRRWDTAGPDPHQKHT